MLKTNWHTHTKRCGHAIGTDEEYVQAAIQGGLTTLGFSDHVAYEPEHLSERMRMREVPDYVASIQSLKEMYRDQIDLYVGMEVECYPDQWETLSRFRREMDYCILGQHYLELDEESTYDLIWPEELERYGDLLEYACKHSLCDYIAHPDVCLYRYPSMDDSVKALAERIAHLSVQYDMPVELNCGSGVRAGKHMFMDGERYSYPTRTFFEAFAKEHSPVIIGLDVHDPKMFLTDEYINRALEVTEGLNLNWKTDFDLVAAAKERKKKFY